MDGSAIAELPNVSAGGRDVERESPAGVTPLVAVCYRLWPCGVRQLLALGADPNRKASFGGGVSPAVATLLGVADAYDVGKSSIKLLKLATRSVEIWAMLGGRGGSCAFPSNILVSRSVMRILQDAASRSGNTFMLVSLVRAEERMHPIIL